MIRHNEITSSDGHYFKDGMGGQENFSDARLPELPTPTSTATIVSHAMDDGIETEGGNRNVRIWGNYIDQTADRRCQHAGQRRTDVHLPQRVQPQPPSLPGRP